MKPIKALPISTRLPVVQVLTNPYPLKSDPYNTPYEGVNWTETYKYYPPGNRYLNPYQRIFPPTVTTQLSKPWVNRVSSTPLTSLSVYSSSPYVNVSGVPFS
jgi:hypothetical protein